MRWSSIKPGASATIGGCATAASSSTTKRRSIISVTCHFRRPFRITSRRTKSRTGSRATSTSWRSISGPERHSTTPNTMRPNSGGRRMSEDPTAPRTPFGPATSCSQPASAAPPTFPKIETLENFAGRVLHSSQFAGGRECGGRSAVVFGTGTSAHDICQELQAHGAEVTMVQRSPTMVVNVDPSAQLYDQSYLGDGPPIDIRDTLNSGMPLAVIKASHQLITNEVKKLDAALLQRLEQVGFRLEFGEDGTGWPLKFRTRGGGYYFNVGCSELIADRKIRLIQATDIKRFTANGLQLGDGSTLGADLVVLATGYKGLDHVVASRFGEAVAARVGPIWGFDDKTQELRNMWTRTRQPGLWFTGGAFSQCRIYSRYIALQIDAIEAGKLAK